MKPLQPKRRSPRVEVSYDGELTASDGHRIPVVVRDLSAEGFRIEIKEELLVGEQVQLLVGKGPVLAGKILWALGSEAGGVFLNAPESAE